MFKSFLVASALLVNIGVYPAHSLEDEKQDFVTTGAKATVAITSRIGLASFQGTGAVISPNGYILTTTTVVPAESQRIRVVFTNGVVLPAKRIASNIEKDLSLIKINADGISFFPLARLPSPLGSSVYMFSNSNNLIQQSGQVLFDRAIVSGRYKLTKRMGQSPYKGPVIEFDNSSNQGSDGAPIVNGHGRLCAILCSNYSPSRWQSVGIPLAVITRYLGDMKSEHSINVPSVNQPLDNALDRSSIFVQQANKIKPVLVKIRVSRKYRSERFSAYDWNDEQKKVADWESMAPMKKKRVFQRFSSLTRLIAANRQIRRPAAPVTGLVISEDGYILTSLFNLYEDTVFINKESEKIDHPTPDMSLESFFRLSHRTANFRQIPNPVEKITVNLSDSRQFDGKIVGKDKLLGIALLKINASQLPFFDIAKHQAKAGEGSSIVVIGITTDNSHPYTLNSGIISSHNRHWGRALQFDALLNYGNSGGPIIGRNGEFYGLAVEPMSHAPIIGMLLPDKDIQKWNIALNSGISMGARADAIVRSLLRLKQLAKQKRK